MNKDIEKRLELIEARNKRVDDNKDWETSWTRRLSIMGLTYIVVAFYLKFVVHIEPWINALVPVLGFLLSTLTISILKQTWINHRRQD
jgi:hypothetical protein